MSRRLVAWAPAAIWAAVLFFLSSRPNLTVNLDGGVDKIAHFGAYLLLGLLLTFATVRLRYSPAVAVVLGIVYGATDELHQSMVPGRFAELGDWLADSLGTVAGIAVYFLVRRMRSTAGPTSVAATAESSFK